MTQEAVDNNKASGSDRRLLIIDDERDFAEYVGEIGEDMGYEVQVTDNAMDFMKFYRTLQPTSIVIDMVMPGVDGVELIGWLAQQHCEAHIMIVTGYNPRYAELAENLGDAKGLSSIKSYTKPLKLADLRQALS